MIPKRLGRSGELPRIALRRGPCGASRDPVGRSASAEAEGRRAEPSAGNPSAPAWAGASIAPAERQAGADGFVDGQIRRDSACAR